MADSADPRLTNEQMMALASLLHFYWYTEYRKFRRSQKDIAFELGLTPGEFNNLLRQGVRGKSSAKAQEGLRRFFFEQNAILEAPDYIRQACRVVFHNELLLKELFKDNVSAVFTEAAERTSEATWTRFESSFSGVYDVYRYAARVIPGQEPEVISETSGVQSYISNAIRAAIRISPRGEGDRFPTFEFHNSPMNVALGNPPRRSRGVILIIDRNIYFIGKEDSFDSPVYFVCTYDPNWSVEFYGLVMRLHDGGGTPFSSRVLFRRNEEAASLDDVSHLLGVLRETELPHDIASKRDLLLNDVEYGGRGALVLR